MKKILFSALILGVFGTIEISNASKTNKDSNDEYKRSMQTAKKFDAVNTVTTGKKSTSFQNYVQLNKEVNDEFDKSMSKNKNKKK